MSGVWLCVGLANLLAFGAMGLDKARARAGKLRIPEKRLLLLCLLMGALGGTLGMRLFRHKTRHVQFYVGLPLMLIAQIGLMVWLIMRRG